MLILPTLAACSAGSTHSVTGPRTTSSFGASAAASTDLYFHHRLGQVEEHTLRAGQTAAHLYIDTATDPYLFVAFPAGNSGLAVWFRKPAGSLDISALGAPRAVQSESGLNGMEVDLRASASSLAVQDSVLGSMRFIRDRELGIQPPPELRTPQGKVSGGSLVLQRGSINGLAEYRLEIEPMPGTRIAETPDGFQLLAADEVRMRVRAFSGEKPLTPLSPREIFKEEALASMPAETWMPFSFLFYKEKLMAGTPRYHTKFGRDSLFTLYALMETMKPEAIESILDATLSSSHPVSGDISHEQHEGDFASFERRKQGKKYKGVTDAIEDYKMVDDDFAFPVVMGKFAGLYPERVRAFLAGRDQRGISRHRLVLNNFRLTARAAAPFTRVASYRNLIRIKKGEPVGNWRDSENGLGGGVYAYDVNTALVPAALKAMAGLYGARESGFYNPGKAAWAEKAFSIWNEKALPFFVVRVPAKDLPRYGETYFRNIGADPARLKLPAEDLEFTAVSLGDSGKPVLVMHSDDSLLMAFGYPSAAHLARVNRLVRGEFPFGLHTPVGILAANAIFASRAWQHKFTERKYHGRVSWAMQEAFLIHGINRQLQRTDLPDTLRAELRLTKSAVEKAVKAKASMKGTEVFSIHYRDGEFSAEPFAGDAKSNSNQLWSHLGIAFP